MDEHPYNEFHSSCGSGVCDKFLGIKLHWKQNMFSKGF
jgi:hypothetical protein